MNAISDEGNQLWFAYKVLEGELAGHIFGKYIVKTPSGEVTNYSKLAFMPYDSNTALGKDYLYKLSRQCENRQEGGSYCKVFVAKFSEEIMEEYKAEGDSKDHQAWGEKIEGCCVYCIEIQCGEEFW